MIDIMDPLACQAAWGVACGDMYTLTGATGLPHTLVCGDACDASARGRFGVIEVLATDPPYGRSYRTNYQVVDNPTSPQHGKARRGPTEIVGDTGTLDDLAWLRLWRPVTAAYVWAHWRRLTPVADAMAAAGCDPKHRIVWDKCLWGSGNLSQYGSQIEDCLCWMRSDYKIPWAKREGNIWRAASKHFTEGGRVGHPTQKALGVVRQAIEHACSAGGIVADPFAGSGTTIIASDQVGRRCVAIELDPKFCALILERCSRYKMKVSRYDQ